MFLYSLNLQNFFSLFTMCYFLVMKLCLSVDLLILAFLFMLLCCLSVCLYVFLSFYLSVFMFIYLSVYLSFCLSFTQFCKSSFPHQFWECPWFLLPAVWRNRCCWSFLELRRSGDWRHWRWRSFAPSKRIRSIYPKGFLVPQPSIIFWQKNWLLNETITLFFNYEIIWKCR